MKIKVYKEEGEITTKFVGEDGNGSDFDYITLINALYEKNIPVLDICEDIEENDRMKINNMYNEICQTVLEKPNNKNIDKINE